MHNASTAVAVLSANINAVGSSVDRLIYAVASIIAVLGAVSVDLLLTKYSRKYQLLKGTRTITHCTETVIGSTITSAPVSRMYAMK